MTATDHAAALARRNEDEAELAPGPANRLAAALDFADPPLRPGDPLPLAWHWLYFLTAPRASTVGPDGRGGKGELVPEFPGLNRMWAGGAFTVQRPLTIGSSATRHSKILSIEEKHGRSGRLVLVSQEHTLSDAAGVAQVERHDLVFRERKPQQAGATPGDRASQPAEWRRTLTPDEVLLFRFSALTYNSHRIHYDWRYTTQTEGYPGLLVHGPLTAILLLDAIRRAAPELALKSLEYRAMRPLYCGNPMSLCATRSSGEGIEVWAEDHEGFVAMRGTGR